MHRLSLPESFHFMKDSSLSCCFCKSNQLTLKYKAASHRFNKIPGPIKMYVCKQCRSLITFPLPSKQQLADLYLSYGEGMSPKIRNLRNNNPLTAWHRQCITRATNLLFPAVQENSTFSWIDVGAGGGELAKMFALQFPNSIGMAIDFHDRPSALHGVNNVTWLSCDLNDNFSQQLTEKFDLVLSITVIEHIMDPESFIKNCNALCKTGGALYITAPCADTLAEKLLGKRWPYYIPGEHLNIPSVKGMDILLRQLNKEQPAAVFSKKTVLPYTLGYFLSFLNLSFLRAVIPHSFPVRLPTGILEAGYGSGKSQTKM
jgi:SAM-dependent methyltransferase